MTIGGGVRKTYRPYALPKADASIRSVNNSSIDTTFKFQVVASTSENYI